MDWSRDREKRGSRFYVALEGVDGVGKTTQLNLLQQRYRDALFLREPGYTRLGGELRRLILEASPGRRAELLLFLADRAELVEKVILPNRHRPIFSDRSLVSGIAYGAAAGFGMEELIELNRWATGGVMPDLVFLLKLDRSQLEARLQTRRLDRIEERGIEYLLEVQSLMEEALNRLGVKYEVLEASTPPDQLHNQILHLLRLHFFAGE